MLEDGICTIGFIDNQFILLWTRIYLTTYEYSLLYLDLFYIEVKWIQCYQSIYLSYHESYQLEIFLCCGFISLCYNWSRRPNGSLITITALYLENKIKISFSLDP